MKTALIATFCVIAGQANALSCMQPDVAGAFQAAAQAEESYVGVLGQFTFDAPAQTGTSQRLTARFEGQALGAEGFVPSAGFDVTLEFVCLGPWCGSITPDSGQTLAFVQRGPDGYFLSVGPCYGNVFQNPRAADVARVEACMRGENCTSVQTR